MVVGVRTVVRLEWGVAGRATRDFWGVGQMLFLDPGVSYMVVFSSVCENQATCL